jgi:hypothetical protein
MGVCKALFICVLKAYGLVATLAALSIRPLSTFTGSHYEPVKQQHECPSTAKEYPI